MQPVHSGHSESPSLVGDTLVDDEGRRVGRVVDVVSRPDTLEPEWLVVKTSMFGRRRLVPMAAATETLEDLREGRIVGRVVMTP